MRTTTYSAAAPFVADASTLILYPGGLQIDWDEIDDAYINEATNGKELPAGKIMVLVAASGKLATRAERPGSETAYCILLTGAAELSDSDALSGYGCVIGGSIYSNLLPDADDGSIATFLTELKAEAVSRGYGFFTYSDDRAS